MASAANPRVTAATSSGASPPGPKTRGKCSGCNRPSRTCASVTVSGPPLPYAAGPGIAPAEFGADAQPRPVPAQDRPAARRDGVDRQHRRPQPDPGEAGLGRALILAGEVRHVGRGAAHVEADQSVEPRRAPDRDHPDNAAGRPRQHRVLAAKARCRDQPAVRLHERERGIAEGGGDAVDIGTQHRRQIGVDDRRLAARHELDRRRDVVADRHLGKAGGGSEGGDVAFVRGVAPAVHQDDRRRAVAGSKGSGEVGGDRGLVEGDEYRAVGVDPLGNRDRVRVERLGQADVEVEQPRPRLVTDPQRVGETAGDDEDDRLAGPRQQRVGRDRRPHADAGDGLAAGDPRDPLGGGVGIVRRVGQQLGRHDAPVAGDADDVGEGPAAIDGEAPGHLDRPC